MKFNLSTIAVSGIVVFIFSTAAFSQTVTPATTQSTVTVEQVNDAKAKFESARTEYQNLVRSGADKASIDSAYSKFIAARDEYQKLNQAAGNCTPGSRQGASQNGGKGNGGNGNGAKLRDGSCGSTPPASISGNSTNQSGSGMGRGHRGGRR